MTSRRNTAAVPKRDHKRGCDRSSRSCQRLGCTWKFAVELPKGPEGQRRQAFRRGFLTKDDAQQEIDKLRTNGREGTYVPPARQTLKEFIESDWLPAVQTRLDRDTWSSYARYLRL